MAMQVSKTEKYYQGYKKWRYAWRHFLRLGCERETSLFIIPFQNNRPNEWAPSSARNWLLSQRGIFKETNKWKKVKFIHFNAIKCISISKWRPKWPSAISLQSPDSNIINLKVIIIASCLPTGVPTVLGIPEITLRLLNHQINKVAVIKQLTKWLNYVVWTGVSPWFRWATVVGGRAWPKSCGTSNSQAQNQIKMQ